MSSARESSSAWSTSSLRSPKYRSTSCRQMTSASTECSSFASRGRSCRSSSPTPWWVLNVTSRTGIGRLVGTRGRLGHVAPQPLRPRPAACRAPARSSVAGPARVTDSWNRASRPVSTSSPIWLPKNGPACFSHCSCARLGLDQPGQPLGEPPRPPAPADPEADPDRVRRLVVQRRDRQLVHARASRSVRADQLGGVGVVDVAGEDQRRRRCPAVLPARDGRQRPAQPLEGVPEGRPVLQVGGLPHASRPAVPATGRRAAR